MSNLESTKAMEAVPEKSTVTTRMMEVLEVIDNLQNQADSILAVSLGHDSNPREAGPTAILDYQVDFALGQVREISEKLSRIYRAL